MKTSIFGSITILISIMTGCAAPQSKITTNTPNHEVNHSSHSNESGCSDNDQDTTSSVPNDSAESQDTHLSARNISTEPQNNAIEILNDDYGKHIDFIEHNKAFYTLNEPWTLKQFEENLPNLNKAQYDEGQEHFSDGRAPSLWRTIKNNDGKAYLIAREHEIECGSEAEIYLGIRDYNQDQMVVNFYYIDDFSTSYQCGTSSHSSTDIDMTPPKKVIYQGQQYLKIDIIVSEEIENYCSPGDFDYDEETGERIEDSCELSIENHSETFTYLYK